LQPIVTLIHYDTPLNFYANLSEQYDTRIGYRDGKYGDEEFQAGFLYYGKILMTHFADRVAIWIT
jgi:beta-glucosidase/6-phospho-beta-glucosidase/beta-galactosidase